MVDTLVTDRRSELVTAMTQSVEQQQTAEQSWIEKRPLAAFAVLAYGISWSLWLVSFLLGEDSILAQVSFVAGGFGPAAAGAIIIRARGESIGKWARAIVKWRVPARYWVYALGLPALLYATTNVLLVAFGETVEWSLIGERLLPYLGTFVLTMFLLGGQEEPGWRGYALPRLQTRFSPLKATALLGVIWGLWHLPLGGPLAAIVPFVLAFFYTWLYNRTGSVLLAILLHASFTPAQDHLILQDTITHGTADLAVGIAYLVGVLTVIVFTRGRLGFDRQANQQRI